MFNLRTNSRVLRTPITTRTFLTSSRLSARADAQDKDSIDRSAIEYTRSGTDNSVAQNEEASFDPKTTRPQDEMDVAKKGNKTNPLEYSPANRDMSPTGEAAEGGVKSGGTKEKGQTRQSGAGSGPKGKKLGN